MGRYSADLSAAYLDAGASPKLTIAACLLGLSTVCGVAVAGAQSSGSQVTGRQLSALASAHYRTSVLHARAVYSARRRVVAQR